VASFKQFSDQFLCQLYSRDFGRSASDRLQALPGSVSSAAKEISVPGITELLSRPTFLRKLHHAGQQYQKLVRERLRSVEHKRKIRPYITKLRNARKTLRSLHQKIRVLDKQTSSTVEWETRTYLHEAIRCLDAVESILFDRESTLVSQIHPRLRKGQDTASRWQLLLMPYEYDLPTLKQKAPEQWLLVEINRMVVRLIGQLTITELTRCTVLTVILECLGVGRMEPTTIKAYLGRLQKARSR
jgi:hypothetical protein